MNIAELLNKNLVEGDYALEIEVEGYNLPHIGNQYWLTTNDGSLRGEALEYISNGPQEKSKIVDALDDLHKWFTDTGSKLDLSYRTSVHVHMNILPFTLSELVALVYLYYVYEELLVKYCGESRVGNRFSLRLRDAEGILDNVLHAFKANGDVLRYHAISKQRADAYGNEVRYSAFNLAAICKFGSVEFRSMRGTVDKDVLLTWVELLDCLKKAALKFKSAKAVKEYMDGRGVVALSEEVFRDNLAHIAFGGWENEVAYNASLAVAIPYEINVKEEKTKKQAMPEWANLDDLPAPAPPPRRRPVRRIPEAVMQVMVDEPLVQDNPQPEAW